MLRRGGSYRFRPAGIWLFCDPDDDSGVKLPMSVQSEAAVQEAGAFILKALASAQAQIVEGTWRKRAPSEAKPEL